MFTCCRDLKSDEHTPDPMGQLVFWQKPWQQQASISPVSLLSVLFAVFLYLIVFSQFAAFALNTLHRLSNWWIPLLICLCLSICTSWALRATVKLHLIFRWEVDVQLFHQIRVCCLNLSPACAAAGPLMYLDILYICSTVQLNLSDSPSPQPTTQSYLVWKYLKT